MFRVGSAKAITDELGRYGVQIAALQEIRWPQQGEIGIGKYNIFYSGRQDNQHVGEVGFCIHKKIAGAVMSFTPINERIAKIKLKGRWFNITIITAHAPTEDKEDEEKDLFYSTLQEVYDNVSGHDIRMIIGDMNAKVGKESETFHPAIGRQSLHSNSNGNGVRLASFALSNDMVIGGTLFQHNDIHKQTWTSPDGATKNQIDHILIQRKHRSALQDTRSYRGADCDSDHNLVIGRVKAKLSTKKTPQNRTKRYYVDRLKIEDVQEEYQMEIRNRFDVLNLIEDVEEEEQDIDYKLKKIEEVVHKAAEEHIGYITPVRRNHWYDEECKEASKECRRIRENLMQNPSDLRLAESLREGRRSAKRLFKQKKREDLDRELDEIESNINDGRVKEHHKKLRAVKKGFQARNWMIKGPDGDMLYGENEVMEQWQQYFYELLNRPDPAHPIQAAQVINTDPIEDPTLAEIKMAIKELKKGKAPGCDEIPAELLKNGGEVLEKEIYRLIKEIWNKERLPTKWQKGIIIPIYKKGSKLECANYRGISLLCVLYKVYTRILLKRLKPYTEQELGEYQCGFRHNRSTTDHIHTVRQLMEKYYEYDKTLYQLFVDFRQAYDSVHRPSLWHIMAELNIPAKLISLIKTCYIGSSCTVRIGRKETESFNIHSGLRQGCMLSPLLFNLVLEKAVRQSTNHPGGARLSNGQITHLAYADDVDVVAETVEEVNEFFSVFQRTAEQIGLKCNEQKTEILKLSRNGNYTPGQEQVGSLSVKKVDKFKYLGSIVSERNELDTEINERIAGGNRCYHALASVMKSRTISRRTKIRTYNIVIKPTVLYGCETWTLTKQREKRLEIFENNILRRILGPVYDEEEGRWRRRHNREIRDQTGQPYIQDEVRGRRARWAGHCIRMESDRLPRKVMEGGVQGRRPLGRPRYRWMDGVRKDVERVAPGEDWKELAEDRIIWRGIVEAVKGRPARQPPE